MEISSGIFIHLLDLTRSSCEKCNYLSSGRNRTCGPAIPMQRSNQLSCRETYAVNTNVHDAIWINIKTSRLKK